MPSAHAILWFLGVFLILWALSLALRGFVGDRARGRRRCPACSREIADGAALTCAACGYEARSERALQAPRRNWRMIAAGAVVAPTGGLVCGLGVWVWGWTHSGRDSSLTLWDSSAAALALFGVILIGWAVRGDRSRGRRRCPRCWYDMTGSGLRCPECGFEAGHASALYRARRRWKTAALASALLIAAVVVQGVPRVQRGGWRAAFPTTVLIAGFPWIPDKLAFEEDPRADENWTLLARFESDRMWGWQRRWVERRARGMLARARTAREVLRGLHFESVGVRRADGRGALVVCLRGLSARDKDERDAAVGCLGELQQVYPRWSETTAAVVRPMLPDLMRLLNDDQQPSDVVWKAAWAVSLAGPEAAPAVPRLMELGAKAGRLRGFGMVGYLRNLAMRMPAIRDQVAGSLDSKDLGLTQMACWTLGHASFCDDATGEKLLHMVQTGDDVRAAAASNALCRAYWQPRVAIPAILDQMRSNRPARAPILESLWNYEDDLLPYLQRLAEGLADPDPQVRLAMLGVISACEHNGNFHLNNSALMPILEAMKLDPDANVAASASAVLAESAQPVP